MGQLKEADFLRWGNTKRMTGLRQAEQDGIWEGIRERKLSICVHVYCNTIRLMLRQFRRVLEDRVQGDADDDARWWRGSEQRRCVAANDACGVSRRRRRCVRSVMISSHEPSPSLHVWLRTWAWLANTTVHISLPSSTRRLGTPDHLIIDSLNRRIASIDLF